MVRIVPRRTKVKLEFVKGFTGIDLLIAVVAVGILIVLAASNFPGHIWIAMVWAIFALALFFKLADSDRFYVTIVHLARFSLQKKKYEKAPKSGKANMKDIIPFEGIHEDRFISYGSYYAAVLEVKPILFDLLNEYSQNNVIDVGFGNALRRLEDNQVCELVKLNKAMVLDNYSYWSRLGGMERQTVSSLRHVVYCRLSWSRSHSGRLELFSSCRSDLRSVLSIYPFRIRGIQECAVQLT